MKCFSVTIYFAHQLEFHFYNISDDDMRKLRRWANKMSDPTLEFVWRKYTYLLDRDFLCAIKIEEMA